VKGKAYNVTVVFTNTQKYFSDGCSCKCIDGNLFCSHILAALCMIYIFQISSHSFSELLHILPEGVMTIQNIPCPWEFLMKCDNHKYKYESK